ncbi:MAG: hypothetical protein M4579_005928 [Chaenotheca gracillima]|nr:MAG: hypothetical protein M4579_005928 [Chaenotheca gracillima]
MAFLFTNKRSASSQRRQAAVSSDQGHDVEGAPDPGLHTNVSGLVGNGQSSSSSNSPTSSESGQLSVILEDDASPPSPSKPPRVAHRPFPRLFTSPESLDSDHEHPPPPYSSLAGVIGPKGEKLLDVRNRRQIARRGGWKRLCIISLVLIAIIVGLVVGLVVGLHKKNQNSSNITPAPPPAPSAAPLPSGPFPAGSYSLTTFLSTVNTNCVANPDTWRCYPYTTYADSHSASTATFNWIIVANSSSPSKYSISSTSNPFALTFTDVPLELRNGGLDSEHYSFSVPMNKVVIPKTSLTSDGTVATCYYNGTTLNADLYTKQPKTFPSGAAASSASASASAVPSSSSSDPFRPYPYATEIRQTISGGSDIPSCFKTINGNPTGSPITDGVTGKSGQCGCLYQNFGP